METAQREFIATGMNANTNINGDFTASARARSITSTFRTLLLPPFKVRRKGHFVLSRTALKCQGLDLNPPPQTINTGTTASKNVVSQVSQKKHHNKRKTRTLLKTKMSFIYMGMKINCEGQENEWIIKYYVSRTSLRKQMEKLMREGSGTMVHLGTHAEGRRRQQSEIQNTGKGNNVDKDMSCVQ